MIELEKKVLEKIGDKKRKASSIYIEGYDNAEIAQALLSLELDGKVELVDFETLVREDGGLISMGVYKKKE
jgi:hypothetical protein